MAKVTFAFLLGFAAMPSALSQKTVYMDVGTEAYLIVTDPAGKKTGIDSRFPQRTVPWTIMEEIPNSTIGFEADDEYATPFTHFEGRLNSPQGDGVFLIDLIGNSTQVTSLTIAMYSPQKDPGVQRAKFILKNIPIEKDSVVRYLFTYHSPIGSSIELRKLISPGSLLRDISAMSKIGWIKKKSAFDEYSGLISSCGAQAYQGNLDGAREALVNILHSISADSSKTLSSQACKSLRADVDSLMKQYH